MIKLSDLIKEEPLEPNGRPEDRNANVGFNKGFPWSFDDPSGIYESDRDMEIELEQWDAFKNAILTLLSKEYGIDLEEDYNLVLETGGNRETTKVKKRGIHIADYYVSWLKKEGNDDLGDLVGLAEDRLPEDFELDSYEDIKELASALCMDSAYGIVSLTVSDYILLDIREEGVGLDGKKQVVNKIGATGLTAFSQNEVKRFQEIADISNKDQGQLEKIHQSLIGRELQTLQDLAKITSRLRQRGFAQSDIEEFLRTYII